MKKKEKKNITTSVIAEIQYKRQFIGEKFKMTQENSWTSRWFCHE